MATSSCLSGENKVGIKVVTGDLGSFQIIEEKSESEDEDNFDKSSRASRDLSRLPRNVPTAISPKFGSVAVSNSENVQLGNNTYFNGPVTIKQVIHNSEHDNLGYENTEEERNVMQKKNTVAVNGLSIKKLAFRLWLKLTIFAVCIILLACICAILTITLTNHAQSNGSPVFNEENTAHTMVEGVFHSKLNTSSFQLALLVVLLTLLLFYMILTSETADKNAISGVVESCNAYNNKNRMYNYKGDPLLIAPNHLRIVSRTEWLASPEDAPLNILRLPAPWVIITHTDTESCTIQSECVLIVRLIQQFHMESRKWFDIGYNFLVAGDGSAYCGRGWDYEGAHTLGYNKYSIGIAFIGTFKNKPPPLKQIEAAQKLIQRGVQLGKIAKDYKLFGHRQLKSTSSPGDMLFNIIKEWPHFVKTSNVTSLVPNY